MTLNDLKHMKCCCCGERCIGRQWYGRDAGFSLAICLACFGCEDSKVDRDQGVSYEERYRARLTDAGRKAGLAGLPPTVNPYLDRWDGGVPSEIWTTGYAEGVIEREAQAHDQDRPRATPAGEDAGSSAKPRGTPTLPSGATSR